MNPLTEEQKQIVGSQGNLVINAVAGSGKTSTLVEYAKARADRRLLYLAFNRSVKEEALRRFFQAGCRNVTVETAHSLAYRELDVRRRFELMKGGNLRVHDVVQLCRLQPFPQKPQQHLVLARHVQKLLTLFCNSAARSFSEIDYLETVTDQKARAFVQGHADSIYGAARSLMAEMYRSRIPITHDAYLKFYQLSAPTLPYSGLLFDEGQDASGVMLDIFLRQAGTKVIVGDQHQSIYSFRNAINSLEKVNFTRLQLTTSFRFRQEVADLAMQALALKGWIGRYPQPVQIGGAGKCTTKDSFAILARGNLRLLKAAIEAVLHRNLRRLHFEGDLNSYVFMPEGASLFDVLYLRLGQIGKIRNAFIKGFGDFDDLLEYIAAADDGELKLVVEIVQEYGPSLLDFIRRLRELQVPREAAEVVFSTVHRAKGQEYDTVELMEDFINGEKLRTILALARKDQERAKQLDLNALAEEVNILYVALTRVRNVLMMGFDVVEGSQGESDYYIYDGRGAGQVAPRIALQR